MAKKYFLYSQTQLKFRKETDRRAGKTFTAGWVIVRGKKMPFTELVVDKKRSMYSDSKVVCYEDPSDVKYQMPKSV